MCLFSDFHYGFRSSWSTANLLTIISDRIARAFNRSGATWVVASDVSKAFNRIWHAGRLYKLKSYGISGQIFELLSSFHSNRRLRVVLDGKFSQENPVNVKVPQGSVFGPTFFLLYIMTFLMMLSVILLSMLMMLLSTLSVTRHSIWPLATTGNGSWIWIWYVRHCWLEQEVACWFQCWKSSTSFNWPV